MPYWQVGAAAVGAIGGLLGGSSANAARAAEARKQREWQERMSNTAHQREVKDLRSAGLNPILSAKLGGASSPPGAMPQVENVGESAIRGASAGQASAAQARQVITAIENVKAQTAKTNAETTGVMLDNQKKQANAPYWEPNAINEAASVSAAAKAGVEQAENLAERIKLELHGMRLDNTNKETLNPLMWAYQATVNRLQELGLNEAEAQSKFWAEAGSVPALREFLPWLKLILGSIKE